MLRFPRRCNDDFEGDGEEPGQEATIRKGAVTGSREIECTTSKRPSSDALEQSHAPPLEIAHVLFMDIVAYSKMAMDEQRHRLRELQQTVTITSEFIRAKSGRSTYFTPHGRCMALVFFEDPEAPVRCALELYRALRSNAEIKLRMGIHTGPVYRVADINANRNVAGGGINTAQRVMDCGDAGHILVSQAMVDVLGQLTGGIPHSTPWAKQQSNTVCNIHLFNLCTDDVGNPKVPSKIRTARAARKSVTAIGKQGKSKRPGSGQYPKLQGPPNISVDSQTPQSSSSTHTVQIRFPQISRRAWLAAAGSGAVLIALAFAMPRASSWFFNLQSGGCNPPPGIPCLRGRETPRRVAFCG